MGSVTAGAPKDLVRLLSEQTQVRTFVETGTYLGDTASWASQHFSRVITVERDTALHEAARARFAGQSNVECLIGDSREVLASVVPTLSVPSLFWLDAHWSGGVTGGQESECPLLDEIALIDDGLVPHLILIDDARLFLAPPPSPHDAASWPSIDQVCHALVRRHSGCVLVVDDVILRVPRELRQALTDHCRRKAASQPESDWPPPVSAQRLLARFRKAG